MTPTKRHGSALARMLPLLLIVVAAVFGFVFLRDFLTFEALSDNRQTLIDWRDRNYALAALTYLGAYVLVVALSLPGGLAMTLGGSFLFGFLPGVIMTVLAATLGAALIFVAAKTGLGDRLHARLVSRAGDSGLLSRLEAGLRQNEVSVLLLIRLVPVVPFFVANLAPAFLGVSTRNYVWTTFVGIIPGTSVFCWIGSGLGAVFERGERPDLSLIFEWQVLGPILGLCALAALPMIVRALRGGKPAI